MENPNEPIPNYHRITFSSCIDADIMLVLNGSESDKEIINSIEEVLKIDLKTLMKDSLSNIVVDNIVIIEKK